MSREVLRTLVFALSSFLFILVGIAVERSAWTQTDTAVAHWFEAHITPARTSLAFAVTQGGSDIFTFGITVLLALWVRRRSRYWFQRVLITIIGGTISNEALKFIFYRHRPQFSHPLLHLQTNSFPSGHTLAATVLFGSLILVVCSLSHSRLMTVVVIPVALAAILLVGASRIYLGVHYFSDVIGGLLEGTAWLTGIGIWMNRKRTHRIDIQPLRIAG